MDNTTFVCFDCRTTARRNGWAPKPLCQHCGAAMIAIALEWYVPKRHDDKGWARLKTQVRERRERTCQLRYCDHWVCAHRPRRYRRPAWA